MLTTGSVDLIPLAWERLTPLAHPIRVRRRGGTAAVLVVCLGLAAAAVAGAIAAHRAPAARAPDPAWLTRFTGCADMLAAVRPAARQSATDLARDDQVRERATGPRRAGGRAAPAYAATDPPEPGVDEPDLVKTDGRRIVFVTRGVLRVVDAARRAETGRVDLLDGPDDPIRSSHLELLLAGDRALVLHKGNGGAGPDRRRRDIPRFTLVDLAGPPKVLGRYTIDGTLVGARRVGTTVRLVVESAPDIDQPAYLAEEPDQLAHTLAAIDHAAATRWLPHYTVSSGGRTAAGQVGCASVRRPASFSGFSFVTLLTFDLGAGELGTGDPVTVVTDASTVYGTASTLYVANEQHADRRVWGEIYKFDTSRPGAPRFVAGGSVDGAIQGLSEWGGRLRVVATADGRSTAYVLGAGLAVVGRVGDLGRGEPVQAVRFAGGCGYVVTFRATDPVYAVDLRDAARPRMAGAVELTGYARYVQPLDRGRLIAVGQETGAGRDPALRVSLFATPEAGAPRRATPEARAPRPLARSSVPAGPAGPAGSAAGSAAEVQGDPRAFLYSPPTGLLVVPVAPGGAQVLRVGDGSLVPVGAVAHPVDGPAWRRVVRRSFAVDRTLWTLSYGGLLASDADTLAQLAWLPLPLT
jgi:hypothetical protein